MAINNAIHTMLWSFICERSFPDNLLFEKFTFIHHGSYSGGNSCCNKSLFMKQKCEILMDVGQYKKVATQLTTRGINTTHQHFQINYITLIYLKGLKSYWLK